MFRMVRSVGVFAETVLMGFAFAIGWFLAVVVVTGIVA